MISETLIEQLKRGEARLPLAAGTARRVKTSEGEVILRRGEDGLSFELVQEAGVAFLPFLGEFGWLVADHIRRVHEHPAKRKLVFCRRGEECLFPSASEFRYDWQDIPDARRVAASEGVGLAQEGRLRASLPDWAFFSAKNGPWDRIGKVKFAPVAKPHGPAFDVVMAPREREHAKDRNWWHWRALAEDCVRNGLTVGIAGTRAGSQDLTGIASGFAWDHPGGATAGTVDMLARCRLYVGTDAGVSHLAALLDTPSIIVNPGRTRHNRLNELAAENRGFCKILPADAWHKPFMALDAIRATLGGQTESARILSIGGEKRVPLGDYAARSLRRIMPGIAVELHSDTPRAEFPTVLLPRCKDRASRAYKIGLLKSPPTEWSAVIDDDTATVRKFAGIRAMLETTGCDIAMAREPFSPVVAGVERHVISGRWSTRKEWDYMLENHPGITAAPHWNSGVIFYRRCEAVEHLADLWLEEWKRFRDVDQLALVRAIARTGIKVGTLPRAFNACYGIEDRPVIAHFTNRKWSADGWKREMGLPVVPRERDCCGGGKPSLLKQAAGIARAVGGVVADVASGRNPAVSAEERKRRLEICKSCDSRDGKRCGLCNCFLSAISWLNQDKCEAGKWLSASPAAQSLRALP